MAIKFHNLKVSEVRKETKNAVSISFDVPDDLKETFKYAHGQYLTLKVYIDGQPYRRVYSINSSPVLNEKLTVTVKKAEEGTVSEYINENLKPGDELEVIPPLGKFTIELDPNLSRHYVMFAGGSGITPLMSILKTVLAVESKSKVTLFYLNRNVNEIIFRHELDKLADKYGDRLKIVHTLSRPSDKWAGYRGRIDRARTIQFINKYIGNEDNCEYFLCGPGGMMREIEKALDELNVSTDKIHKESFTVPVEDLLEDKEENKNMGKNVETPEEELEPELKTRKVKIILYADEDEFEVEPDETIVEAALREGIEPPFSCQMGACSTCRAKLLSGKVYMDEREALTDDEIEQGYVLTCQSHPLTDDVVVDYDE